MRDRVFLDASFWIAYRDLRSDLQRDATRILADLFRRQTIFVTTFPVICEIQAYFSRSPKLRKMVLDDLWQNPVCHIEPVSYDDQEVAVSILRNMRDKCYSLCDATSFAVMQRMQIRRAATYDDHFVQFGIFEIIR